MLEQWKISVSKIFYLYLVLHLFQNKVENEEVFIKKILGQAF